MGFFQKFRVFRSLRQAPDLVLLVVLAESKAVALKMFFSLLWRLRMN